MKRYNDVAESSGKKNMSEKPHFCSEINVGRAPLS